jgi:flagellar basal-body rod modification protein FlgD
MTTINNVTATTTGPSTPATKAQVLGKDDFLRLLVTQLKYQDPLNPLDQNQFLSQTAQFTSLEHLQNINDGLENLMSAMSAGSLVDGAALVGRTVRASTRDVIYQGSPLTLSFALEAPVSSVGIDIVDSDGTAVRHLVSSAAGAGVSSVTWDGLNTAGRPVAPGVYRYVVSSGDGSGPQPAAVSGVITGLSFVKGQPVYSVGDASVRPGEIIELR